ncbi:metallophosphoesterase [Fibrobacter succinogenes]|uniref:metallophosphoesterase n=1 Tax=Fibrobacter succinogenes TaxID=833 RepID=UPI00156A108C|nr:metallophosphoesterase [Fibrobacter succinogenes]
MTYYFISDLHVDFYVPMTRTVTVLRKHFEVFFERNFLPADACCIAGDIANNYFTYVEFLKFIAEKYSMVYVCLGNHDIITESMGRFGLDRDFATSESKIKYFLAEAKKISNIQLLENRISGNVAGCMGMCDFKYKHSPAASEIANKILWATRWFDARHWKYMQNNTDKLWRHYDRAFRELTAQRPKIMMSHFLPLEFEMVERYKHDPYSNFFYFHGAKYLENLDDGSIWQAGHIHTAIKREYTDRFGKKHLLLCNPVGYPDENPYAEHGLKQDDFVVEVG